jgi:hypothetical protein
MKRMLPILAASLVLFAAGARAERVLDVPPVRQESPVWCWVAVSEMVLRHYDVPNVNPVGNYQCGFIGINAIASNQAICNQACHLCNFPAGSGQVLKNALEEYPRRVAVATGEPQPRLRVTIASSSATFTKVRNEIDADRPIIIGITPAGKPLAGGSAHVAVIRGYREGNGRQELLVNDPFPFELVRGMPNPYISAGAEREEPLSYWIGIQELRNRLAWNETFYISKAGTHQGKTTGGFGPAPATMCVNPYTGQGCGMSVPVARGTPCNCFGMPGVAY